MTRKIISISVLFLSSLLILTLFILPALAQGENFNETFEDVQLPGWEHSPEVIVVDGELNISPGNFAALVTR